MSWSASRNSLQNDCSFLRRKSYDHNRRSISADGRSRSSGGPSGIKNRPSSEERKSSNYSNWNGPRRSSILNEPKALMKDPRPLNEKSYQKRKTADLVEFLQETGFPFPVTPGKLMTPSKKDFENIFQHFVQFWDDRYVVKRIEEEAPKILKDLCYPFIPNKTAFLYVARTNWPPLLGILLFLLDVTMYANKLDSKLLFRTTDEEHQILLEFVYSCYTSKNEDEETTKNTMTEMAKRIVIPWDMDELQQENVKLKNYLQNVQSEIEKINSLKTISDQQRVDVEKYEDYFRKLKDRHQKKIEACQKLSDDLALKESELQVLNAIRDKKQEAYDAQGFDGRKQVSYYEKQRKELEEKLQERKNALRNLQQKCWEVEMQHTDTIDQGTSICESFNERYSSVSQMSEKVLESLRGIQDPQVKSVCHNLSVVFPDYKLKPIPNISPQGANPRPKLEEIKQKVDSVITILESLRSKQSALSSENEMKMSGLSIAIKVASVEETQKERELSSNEKQVKEKCEELDVKYDKALKSLEKLRDERTEIENKNKELSEQLLFIENAKKEKQNMLEEYIKEQRALFSRYQKAIEETEKLAEECGEEIYKALEKNIK